MKKIRASLLYTICQNVPDAVCMIDMDWKIMSWNKGAEETLGYKEDELLGQSIAVIIPEDIAQKEIDHCITELNTKGKMSAYETLRLAKDGRIVPVELTAVLLQEAGRSVGYAAIMRDISDRKRVESALSRSEATLRTIFNASNEAIFIHDMESGQILQVNEKFFELYGYDPDELKELTVGSLSADSPGYTNSDAMELLKRAAAGEPQLFEWRARKKSGELFWASVHLKRAVIDGEPRILAMVRDITVQKEAEDALKLTQFSVDHASVCSFLIARDASILYANEWASRTLGYSREELLKMAIPDLDPNFPHSAWDDHWKQLREEGSLKFETLHRKKNGDLIPVDVSVNYLSFGGREYNVAFSQDISDRKNAEKEIARINRQRELILESAGDGIFGIDDKGDHIFTNSAGKKMLGYDDHDLLGRNSHSIWHHTRADGSPYPAGECKIYQTRKDGISRHVDDEVFWTKDGRPVPVEYTTTPIREADAIVGSVVTFRDVTERKRMEEALHRSYAELESKVTERTRELVESNRALQSEIRERHSALATIKRSKEMSDALNRLATVIHSTLHFDEVMQRVAKDAALAIGAEATMIGVFEGDIFHVRYSYNVPAKFKSRKLTSNELRAIQHVAAARDAIAFNDAFNDKRLNRAFVKKMGIHSLLAAPLIVKQQMFGVISFYGLSRRITFEEVHLDFGRKLSASISLAIENARLYDQLSKSEEVVSAVLNSVPDMAWMKDREGRFVIVNDAFGKSAGKKPEDLAGRTDYDAWPENLAKAYRTDDQEVMESRARKRVEEPLAESNGTVRWIETIKTPFYDKKGDVIGTVGIARDITRRKQMEEEIRHMAQHDALTGLPNRRLFLDILKVELAQSRRHRSKLAILYIDLDRFKEVNDSVGHEAGDSLLKEIAERFRKAVRESDTVARLGGDEFNIILSDIARSEDISEIALKIIDSIRKPITAGGHELHTTVSVGISVFPDDGEDPLSLLRFADMAMYHAKENGRDQFRFYNPIINSKSLERIKFEAGLRQAIERDELVLHFQPLVDLSTKRIVSAEALVRWRHPDMVLLEPEQFIPAAEESGLIVLIDDWVLGAACRQIKEWRDEGLKPVCVTVNLSERKFCSPDLVPKITQTLGETGIEPEGLNLEIAENTIMGNLEHASSRLAELANLGLYITIEDFGTGHSSLNYLKRLPINYLKIDKSFVRGIATDHESQAIISAVILMAHKMNMKVIAEGVETENQLIFLGETHCDEAQGYLFSRPLPPKDFGELIAVGI